jgi:hypothetical protein
MPQTKQAITNEMIWNLLLQMNQSLNAIKRAEHIDTDAAIADDDFDEDEDGDRHDGFADDTEFLMSNPKNWERIMQAAKDMDEGKNIVEMPIARWRK